MRDIFTLFLHAIVTIIRLGQPGGLRSVVAESVLMRHQILILNRGRKRATNLRSSDRIIAGLCTLLMRPARVSPLQSATPILKGEVSMRFERVSFGSIRIDETTYEHDVVIDRGRVRRRKKKIHPNNFAANSGTRRSLSKRRYPGSAVGWWWGPAPGPCRSWRK